MKLYTVREVATILRKRQEFVRNEITTGKLDAIKLGLRGTRISKEALQKYLSKVLLV